MIVSVMNGALRKSPADLAGVDFQNRRNLLLLSGTQGVSVPPRAVSAAPRRRRSIGVEGARDSVHSTDCAAAGPAPFAAQGVSVGDLVQADLIELRSLGTTLGTISGDISGIQMTATVTMPGSPVTNASAQGTAATMAAYARIGGHISQMSVACAENATTYESVDQAFRSQFQKYQSGLEN